MKILMANKFYHIVGGSERYLFDLSALLESHGHQVFPFSMQHPKNFDTPYSPYFVSNIDFDNTGLDYRLRNLFKIISKSIYSLESKRKIKGLIQETSPDLAHLHLISHQISPSILEELKKFPLPVVQTLHEYKLICPNYRLYDEKKKEICELCRDRRYYHAFLKKCLKRSLFASLLGSAAMYVHKRRKIYEKNIDVFISPSEFLRKKVVEFGIEESKVEFLPNFVHVENFTPCYDFLDYFVYVGRLSAEKGLFTLLKAMKAVDGPRLKIVGRGPLEIPLKKFAAENNLTHVEFTGFLSGEDLVSAISKAMFVVMPSEWYENCPMVLLEAFALGTPAIGSDLGGIPGLIQGERNGFVFTPGDADDLAEKINLLAKNPGLIRTFSQESRKKVENTYNAEVHYQRLMSIYEKAINKS